MDLGRYTIVNIGAPLLTFFTSEPDRFGVGRIGIFIDFSRSICYHFIDSIMKLEESLRIQILNGNYYVNII